MSLLNKATVSFIQKILLLAVFLVLGVVITNQYLLYRQLGNIKEGSDPGDMAVRVSKLYADNEKLKTQLNERLVHEKELGDAMSSSSDTQKLIEQEKEKYQVILGMKEVSGPGVVVQVSHRMVTSQLVDFVDALRNSGAEALAINKTRVLTNTSMDQFQDRANYTFEIIGDKDVLYDSLTRPGGIFELIVNGEAERSDQINLPKA